MKGWDIVTNIKKLLEQGMSVSGIARKLGIDRRTVRKYRDMDLDEYAEYRKKGVVRTKKLAKYGDLIRERCKAMAADGMINAQTIYEELKKDGYQGSARSVRRWVERRRKKFKSKLIYQPFETEPGHQAMVDFGEKRKVRVGGAAMTLYFAVMILSYSRKKHIAWFDWPIDTEMFLNFHQEAFAAFGGVPQEIVYDQTKLAVIKEEYGEVEFNEAFHRYAEWCAFKPYVCRKYDPETKGKVEAAIGYVKKSFLLGRSFASWGELLAMGQAWLEEFGNGKQHATTGRIPDEAWRDERDKLGGVKPGNAGFSPAYRVQQVYKDGFVKVLGNRYSVPYAHHNRRVKVRIGEEVVEIRDLEGAHLWTHSRLEGKNRRTKEASHYRKEPAESTAILLVTVEAIYGTAFANAIKRRFPRHVREQCQRLAALAETYEAGSLRRIADRLVAAKCEGYKNVKDMLVAGKVFAVEE